MNTIRFFLFLMILGICGYYLGVGIANFYLKSQASKECDKKSEEFIKLAEESKSLADSLYLYASNYLKYSELNNCYSPDTLLMYISKNEAICSRLLKYTKTVDSTCYIYEYVDEIEEITEERFEIVQLYRNTLNEYENKKVKVKKSQL